jgi:hypothetical protein
MYLIKKNPSAQLLNQPSPSADKVLLNRLRSLERILVSPAGQDSKRSAGEELDRLAASILAKTDLVAPKVLRAVLAIYRDLGRLRPPMGMSTDNSQMELF